MNDDQSLRTWSSVKRSTVALVLGSAPGARGALLPLIVGSSTVTVAVLETRSLLPWWALVLTVCQAATMLACGRDLAVGWTFGLGLQAPWVAYDIASKQLPFVVTSVICVVAQLTALHRLSAESARALDEHYGFPEVELQGTLRHLEASRGRQAEPCDAVTEAFGLMWDGTPLSSPWRINRESRPIDPAWVLGNLGEQTMTDGLESDKVRRINRDS